MAVEALAWPLPPADTDEKDGSQAYNMGVGFSLVAPTPLPGIEWRVPDAIEDPPGGVHAMAIWNADTGVRLAFQTITPTPGATERYTFTGGPVAGLTGVNYIAVIYTNHYVFRASNPAGVTSPSGNIVAGTGFIAAFNGGAELAPIPNESSGLTFYISPLGGEDEGEPEGTEATGSIELPLLGATGALVVDNPVEGALVLPPLGLSGELGSPGELVGELVLPGLGVSGALDLAAVVEGALVLPELDLLGELAAGAVVSGALALPALDLVGTAVVETGDVEPETSAIPSVYGDLVEGLRPAFRAAKLRLVGMTDVVGKGDVVIGPPTFTWEALCDPDEPDSVSFSLFVVEAVGERAIEKLLAKLPAVIRAVQAYRDATITGPVVPGSYPAGASDLPCYQLTVEMTL